MAIRNVFYTASLALSLFLALDILAGSALLICGFVLNALVVPVSALLSCAITLRLCRNMPCSHRAVGMFAAVCVVVVALGLSALFYDGSYDGNSYQKVAIGALAHGWNPVYESIETYYTRASLELSPITHALWADHYPKASWMVGSSLYVITGSIESAKAINVLSAAALFGVTFDYLNARFLKRGAAVLASFLLCINPITVPQMFTNYVDGLLATTLLLIIVVLFSRSDALFDRHGVAGAAMLAAAIVVCVNIKFTGFVYAGFFCGAFYVLSLLRARKRGKHAVGKAFRRLTGYYLAVVGVSVLLAGSGSYVPNTLDHGSPFYPLISSQTVDIINGYQPDSFQDMNRYEQFTLSLFSKTQNLWKEPINLKVPFTASPDELSIAAVDTRRAGFGAFFSGIFLVSAAVCVCAMIRFWRGNRALLGGTVAALIASFALVGMTDGSWWARYTPYLWVVPVMALVALLSGRWRAREVLGGKLSVMAAGALALLMVADVATFLPAVKYAEAARDQVGYAAERLRAYGETGETPVVALSDPALGGVLYNLADEGVEVEFVSRIEGEGESFPVCGATLTVQK